jgi:50S ribosomal protein L16 3-hydroxylase
MLREWIAPLPVDGFKQAYLQQSAWARPSTAKGALATLDWATLGEVLAAQPDAIVCAKGKHLGLPVPRDLDEVRAYFRIGIGLCVRHTERCHPKLAAIAAAFEQDLGRSVQVQLFVTPGGTHGFGWHYDLEDVFIAQTVGVKDYYFRENTIERTAPFPPPSFAGFHLESSPIMTATLVPGDFLYIPSRWWHMAQCKDDALSISVGVSPE